MNSKSKSSILEVAKSRYTTKAYQAGGSLTADELESVKSLLQLSPSSINIQPWHFILATSKEGKTRVAKAATGNFSYNKTSIEASALAIVFCAKTSVDLDYANTIVAQEEKDGRFLAPEHKKMREDLMRFYIGKVNDEGDAESWIRNQVYINLGFFILGVSALGLNATPMEGVEVEILNEEFGLRGQGLAACFVVTVGRSDPENDYNAKLPKSRLAAQKILSEL